MSKETLLIPVAGAANYGREKVSTAALHFYFMIAALRSLEDVQVTHPIVPSGLGVFGSLNKMYGDVAHKVEALREADPDQQRIVVGHSLGGLMGRRLQAEGLVDGVVAIGTPNTTLRRSIIPPVPPATRAAYRQFAEAIPDNAQEGTLALIGSRFFDEVVPPESSLAPLRGATHHEFRGATTHNLLLFNPGVIRLTTQLVRQMVAVPELQSTSGLEIALPQTA